MATISSLKVRMTNAPDPDERPISTSGAGTWLDSLRGSFEHAGGKPSKASELIPGRLRSA